MGTRGSFKKGHVPTKKTRDLMSISRMGEKNPNHHSKKTCWNYKGENASYSTLHARIRILFGRPKQCQKCRKKNSLSGRNIIQYASKNGLFSFNRKQWLELCQSCHRMYDNSRK